MEINANLCHKELEYLDTQFIKSYDGVPESVCVLYSGTIPTRQYIEDLSSNHRALLGRGAHGGHTPLYKVTRTIHYNSSALDPKLVPYGPRDYDSIEGTDLIRLTPLAKNTGPAYLRYTVNIPAGTYKIEYQTKSSYSSKPTKMRVYANGSTDRFLYVTYNRTDNSTVVFTETVTELLVFLEMSTYNNSGQAKCRLLDSNDIVVWQTSDDVVPMGYQAKWWKPRLNLAARTLPITAGTATWMTFFKYARNSSSNSYHMFAYGTVGAIGSGSDFELNDVNLTTDKEVILVDPQIRYLSTLVTPI